MSNKDRFDPGQERIANSLQASGDRSSEHSPARPVRVVAVLLGLFALAFTVHPFGSPKTVPPQSQAHPLPMNPAVDAIFARSCANCHSDNTEWPWYSHVPPISWLIERDVAKGREHLNASRWSAYTPDKKIEILADIARVVSNREMPVPQYLLIHKDAGLADQDVQVLLSWAGKERRFWREISKTSQQKSSTPRTSW